MKDGLDAARALLPGVDLRLREELAGSARSTVARVSAHHDDGTSRSLVVKHYVTDGEGWAREGAALDTLGGAAPVPRLVACGAEPPVLVFDDLGAGPSVATALLGDDADAAGDAVVQWAEAVAALHVASRGAREQFDAALAARAGDLPIDESTMPVEVHDAVRVLDLECAALGVAVPPDALDGLRSVAHLLGGAGTAALSPADTCPDNNVRVGDHLVLVDFEGAQWRHVAWDVAYLRVPWPSCWCSWALPDDVADRAVDAYRRLAEPAFPEIGAATFDRELETAVVAWSLVSTTWYLRTALDDDPPSSHGGEAPTRRAMILQRLDRAARSPELPATAQLAGLLADGLRDRWGDVRLDLAPAFRT